jgi:hypothetical protein
LHIYIYIIFHSILQNNQTIPWSIVLLEKLVATQLVEKFPAFYWSWWFITLFTRDSQWSLSWAICIRPTFSQHIYIKSVQISSRLHLGLPSVLSGFPPKILYTFLISPMRANRLAHFTLLFCQPNNTRSWWSIQGMKLLMYAAVLFIHY